MASSQPISFEQQFWDHDWASTPVGAVDGWRSTLAWSVDFMLSSPDPLFILWGDQRALLFNRAFHDIAGDRYLPALGKSLKNLWAPIWERVEGYVEDAFRGHASIVEEVPLPTWSSEFKETAHFTFSYTPIRDRQGTVLGASCTTRDVTSSVLDRRRTRNERDLLFDMFENTPGFVAVAQGPEHRFVFANASYKKLVGRDDLIGKPVREMLPEIVDQGFVAILDEVYRTGEPFVGTEVPMELTNASGTLEQRFIDMVYQPARDAEGNITGIFAGGHDVTDHRLARARIAEAEEIIRQRAEQFRKTLDHIPQMVWSTRPNGHHDYFSRAWYEFTGVPDGSTDGEGWNDVLHSEDQAGAWETWRQSLATGEPYEKEYRLRHRNGDYRWVLGRAWPAREQTGAIVRWYGTCTDIHDRVVAEEKVADLQNEIIHLARFNAMGTMAATLAHEVNQPLTAAANYVVGLRRMIDNGASLEQIQAPLAEVAQSVHRAGDIIRRLRVMFTRAKQADRQICEPQQLIENARRLAEAGFPEAVTIEVDCQQMPAVLGDAVRIEQVLINLIKNAAEAMTGQDKRKMAITTSIEGDKLIFCVADEGPGIPPEELPHLFDAFRSTKDEGMGIGLSVSRTIVEDHGGLIWAANREGGGAQFCFSIPFA